MSDRGALVAEESGSSLLPAIARGDTEAADELFRLYGQAILRFVYRRVENQLQDAEEITLDTFVSAVKLAPTFDLDASVFSWLCGIAKLRIVDFFRKTNREKRIPTRLTEELTDLHAGHSSLEQVLDKLEAKRVVEALLSSLNEEEREAVLLRFVEGLSTREAAVHMKRTERGIESLLLRAKNKAKDQMEHLLQGGRA